MLQNNNVLVSDGHFEPNVKAWEFADDIALLLHTRAQMQHKSLRLNNITNTTKPLGLR